MAKHFGKQFKLNAVQYYHDHEELCLQGCAKNFGISQQTIFRWQKDLRDTDDMASREAIIILGK
jgi:transposase